MTAAPKRGTLQWGVRALAWAAAGLAGGVQAQVDTTAPYKLTVADYRYDAGYSGQDVNLRWRRDGTDLWIGVYHDPVFGSQWRTGADTSVALGPGISVQPSLQAATQGFVGASLAVQAGDPVFASLGWGRTNLRPYFNLNFDPNDAVTASVGWHDSDERAVSLTLVADDRLHTGQRDWHLTARWPLGDQVRITADLLYKSGLGDGGPVRGWGWTFNWDIARWFVRLARDPKQNFSTQDVTRLAAGVRF